MNAFRARMGEFSKLCGTAMPESEVTVRPLSQVSGTCSAV